MVTRTPLSVYDKAFLLSETALAPMHVGSLSVFTLPDNVDADTYLDACFRTLRNAERLRPPFGQALVTGPLGVLAQSYWQDVENIDLDAHIKRIDLGGDASDGAMYMEVSDIHAIALDRARPLWELYLIQGLAQRRFAIYVKVHHAAMDGSRAMALANSIYADSPKVHSIYSPLDARSVPSEASSDADAAPADKTLQEALQRYRSVGRGIRKLSFAALSPGSELSPPFLRVPKAVFNKPVGPMRSYAACSWQYDRLQALAKALGGSLNDVILAICAGGLRNYLQVHSALPRRSLKANVPLSLRRQGDTASANMVASFSANLATDIADPLERFDVIRRSTMSGKQMLRDMHAADAQVFSTLMYLPGILMVPRGFKSQLPPFNIVISKLPDITAHRYWNGARLSALYPVSLVTEGQGLNITFLRYGETVDLGITACADTIPKTDMLIRLLELALRDLEVCVCGMPWTGSVG